jgi:hypothetical protein
MERGATSATAGYEVTDANLLSRDVYARTGFDHVDGELRRAMGPISRPDHISVASLSAAV